MGAGNSIVSLRLVGPDLRPTPDFVREWRDAGAAIELNARDPIATPDGRPSVPFLRAWVNAWDRPGRDTHIAPMFRLWEADGRFTPLGLARWFAATGV